MISDEEVQACIDCDWNDSITEIASELLRRRKAAKQPRSPKISHHLTILNQFQAWRRGSDDRQKIPMPDPKEIGKALDWAIRELAKAKRGSVHTQKRTP